MIRGAVSLWSRFPTICRTYFSASWGPESWTRLAMSCKDNVKNVCQTKEQRSPFPFISTQYITPANLQNKRNTRRASDYCNFRPWLASECSSCRVRTGIVWPGRCCCRVQTSRCVCWPEDAALPGYWWRTPEPARGKHYWGALHHKHTHKRWLAYGAFKGVV